MRGDPAALWPEGVGARPVVRGRDNAFLRHALAADAPRVEAVRLRMRGEIRLGGRWRAFTAEEVIHAARGFVWRARVGPLISGFDAAVDGAGCGSWKLLGIVPVARGSGPDITRSAIGRWLAEAIWLPTMLLPVAGARWDGTTVTLARFGQTVTLGLDGDPEGRLRQVRLRRWGDPGDGRFGDYDFGAIVEDERAFGAFTIPSRVRVGWHLGGPGWATGEFFRATVLAADFR